MGKKYGLNQWLDWLIQLAMAIRAAFLDRGAGTIVVSQDSCRLRPLYVPMMSRMTPKYRAPTFSVPIRIPHPPADMMMGMTMCQVDSRKWPQDHARAHAPM